MSFIDELERLTQACKDFESHYEYEKRRLFLGRHADEIAELVKAAKDVSASLLLQMRPPLKVVNSLFDALAALNKEKP